MTNIIPHFNYQLPSSFNKQRGFIQIQGEAIHEIESLDEFYKELGYTLEIAKSGVLPDEFVWETYFRHHDRNCASCYQLHFIKYLAKHSATFSTKYRNQWEEWFTTFATAKAICGVAECADRKQ